MDFRAKLFELKTYCVKNRVYVNRVIIVLIVVLLTHPRNRFFFAFGFLWAFLGAITRLWAKGTIGVRPAYLERFGPYRFVRHPMYLGTALEALGVLIACFNFTWFLSFVSLGCLLVGYFLFVYKEAALLEEEYLYRRYHDEWNSYARSVPAFFPKKEVLKSFSIKELASFSWVRFEETREWRNFLAFLGIFMFLWLKLVYRL